MKDYLKEYQDTSQQALNLLNEGKINKIEYMTMLNNAKGHMIYQECLERFSAAAGSI